MYTNLILSEKGDWNPTERYISNFCRFLFFYWSLVKYINRNGCHTQLAKYDAGSEGDTMQSSTGKETKNKDYNMANY